MSFQITVLKVLAGQPEGRASLTDLKCAVAILISSGRDWTDRTKRLAARAPQLDIFSQAFVLRTDAGWEITDLGRSFLTSIEQPAEIADKVEPEVVVTTKGTSPVVRLVAIGRRRSPRTHRRILPSAVA